MIRPILASDMPSAVSPLIPGGHRAVVGVDAAPGHQEQLTVEQLPVQPLARQAPPAACTQDLHDRFGALHYACLQSVNILIAWPPSPCGRLSRPPWRGVTPATNTRPVSP